MKEIKHLDGGRNYFGDDFLTLQKEQIEALESILQPYGNVVLNGCEVTDSNLKSGICFLDGKVRRVPAMDKITLPAYIIAKDFEEGNRPYEIGGDKSAYKVFGTEIVQVAPTENNYIKIETDGSSKKLDNSLLDKIRTDISNLENEKANKTYVDGELNKKVNLSNRTDNYTDSSTSKWVSALGLKKLYDWVVGRLGTKYDKKSGVDISTNKITMRRNSGATSIECTNYLVLNNPDDSPISLNHYNKGNILFALGGGKVGIKKDSPTEALDVNGNIKANGSIKTDNRLLYHNPNLKQIDLYSGDINRFYKVIFHTRGNGHRNFKNKIIIYKDWLENKKSGGCINGYYREIFHKTNPIIPHQWDDTYIEIDAMGGNWGGTRSFIKLIYNNYKHVGNLHSYGVSGHFDKILYLRGGRRYHLLTDCEDMTINMQDYTYFNNREERRVISVKS